MDPIILVEDGRFSSDEQKLTEKNSYAKSLTI